MYSDIKTIHLKRFESHQECLQNIFQLIQMSKRLNPYPIFDGLRDLETQTEIENQVVLQELSLLRDFLGLMEGKFNINLRSSSRVLNLCLILRVNTAILKKHRIKRVALCIGEMFTSYPARFLFICMIRKRKPRVFSIRNL